MRILIVLILVLHNLVCWAESYLDTIYRDGNWHYYKFYETVKGKYYSIVHAYSGSGSGELAIPDYIGGYPVSGIEAYAFNSEDFYGGYTSLCIARGATYIGAGAFRGCKGLESVFMTEAITSIGDSAFDGCARITSVTIPARFSICTTFPSSREKITEIVFRDGDEAVVAGSCSGCKSLQDVTLPSSITNIGAKAFRDCQSLRRFSLSEHVTVIGNNAFGGCTNLLAFDVNENNPIYANLNGLLVERDRNAVVSCPGGVDGVSIPDGVQLVDEYAFYGCSRLEKVDFPLSVSEIGSYAFMDCLSLQSVELPNTMSTIAPYSFSGCVSLRQIALPTSLSVVGAAAFIGCSSLSAIEIPSGAEEIGERAFRDCSSLALVRIPASVSNIATNRYYGGSFYGCSAVRNVEVPGSYRLKDLFPDSYESITNAALAADTRKISASEFADCSSLETVVVPSSVTTIETGAFANCSNLKRVFFEGDAPDVGENIFDGTSRRMTVYVKKGSIGWNGGISTDLPESWNGRAIEYSAGESDPVVQMQYTVKLCLPGAADPLAVIECESNKVYQLKRFIGWKDSNGKLYDDGMLIFNLAKPGETVTMTAIWE